jgi:hypothetical protein
MDTVTFNTTLSIHCFTELIIMLCLMNHRTVVHLYCGDADPTKKNTIMGYTGEAYLQIIASPQASAMAKTTSRNVCVR